jgi:hypothetical protein
MVGLWTIEGGKYSVRRWPCGTVWDKGSEGVFGGSWRLVLIRIPAMKTNV